MFLTLLGWLLIVSSVAIWAPLILPRREQLGLEIASRLRLAKRDDGTAANLIAAAAVFLLVAGIGAASAYLRGAPETAGVDGSEDEILGRLSDYSRSIAGEKPAADAASELLPDVTTMIARLAARLESAPDDVQGWRMLGWSYFNTGRYDEAAAAYARAAALAPSSAEIETAYQAAQAKASAGGTTPPVAPAETDAAVGADAAIRSMVDKLADRLERSPRDAEGWTRLMRSRVVLGEKEVAATALRQALEVFKDDSEASAKITAAAVELGLKAE